MRPLALCALIPLPFLMALDACVQDNDGDGCVVPVQREDGSSAPVLAVGTSICFDCDDSNGAVHPGAREILANGIDEDCDGIDWQLVDIAAGAASGHALSIDNDGRLWGWGENGTGQVGDGTVDEPKETPVPVALEGKRFKSARGGAYHSVGLTVSGQVYTWGSNQFGALGLPTTGIVEQPALIEELRNVVEIDAGDTYSMALANHKVYVWGTMCGDNDRDGASTCGLCLSRIESPTPLDLSRIPGRPVHIAAGRSFAVVVMEQTNGSADRVYAWGSNYQGQLAGTVDAACVDAPVQIPLPEGRHVVQITAGGTHALALMASENPDEAPSLYGWGDNLYCQLGGDGCWHNWPDSYGVVEIPLNALGVSSIVEIAAGNQHSMAIGRGEDAGIIVLAWGSNQFGQLGNGGIHGYAEGPTETSIPEPFVTIATGASSSYAVGESGAGYAWGENTHGQLGSGTTDLVSSPQLIAFPPKP